MYLSLYFGWKGAPGTWGVVSTLILQYIAKHIPDDPSSHGEESFEVFQFVDDGGFDEPALGLRPWISTHLWERSLAYCVGPEGLNKRKKEIEGYFATQVLMWGGHGRYREGINIPP